MLNRIYSNITSLDSSLASLALMFLLPFIVPHATPLIPAFHAEWFTAVLGVLAMLTLLRKNVWQSLQLPQIGLVMIGLLAIVLMQWMLGMLHSAPYALLVISYLVMAFLLTILGAHLRHELGRERVVTALAWSVLAGGMINVAFFALQIAVQEGIAIPYVAELQGYGLISQSSHFVGYITLSVASVIYLYAKGRLNLKVLSIVLALLLSSLVLNGSSLVWLTLFMLTALAIIMQVNAMRQQSGSKGMRSLVRVILLIIPAFAFLKLVIGSFSAALMLPPATGILASSGNAQHAIAYSQLWQQSWHMFMQSPWLGIGVGQMPWQSFLMMDHAGAGHLQQIFTHANNLFMHLLAEMGIVAPLLVLAGIAVWIKAFKWRELSMEGWWLLSMLAVLMTHSMFDNTFGYLYFLSSAALLLGLGEEKLTSIKLSGAWATSARGAFAVMMLMGIVNVSNLATANSKLEPWVQAAMTEKISPQDVPRFFHDMDWVHSNSVLAPYAETLLAASLTLDYASIEDKLWISQSALQFMPVRKIAYRHVLLLKLHGDEQEAVKQLNRTLTAYPGNFTRELNAMPFKYWQDYLDVLSIARPIPIKGK